MIVASDKLKLNIKVFPNFDSQKTSLFLLHGFTGSARDWDEVCSKLDDRFNKIAIDLIGHGKSDAPAEKKCYSADAVCNQILTAVNHFTGEKIILLGYSMGGRAALNFSLNHPEKIKVLILESASAGIENEDERKARIISDEQLAEFIETHTMEKFVNKWMEMDIFKSLKRLPEEKLQKLKIAKLQNSKIGLANSLRGFGTGRMPFLGDKLSACNFSVLLISGELDEKFKKINKELVIKFPDAKHKIISGAGHNVHLENPEKFIESVNPFLSQF